MIAEMESHQLINSTSMDVEYFSPTEILDAARVVLGGIDLDPASCSSANEIVRARSFLTHEDNAMHEALHWHAMSLWLNFPFGRKEDACAAGCEKNHVHHAYPFHGNQAWVSKLIRQFNMGHFNEACCLCYASTSEKWFKPLLAYPQCFLYGRTNYLLPDGTVKKGVTKGSVVNYLGPNINKFAQSFKHLGAVKIPYHY